MAIDWVDQDHTSYIVEWEDKETGVSDCREYIDRDAALKLYQDMSQVSIFHVVVYRKRTVTEYLKVKDSSDE